MGFTSLGLPGYQEQVLDQLGFTEPTPIQRQAIPVLLAGQDVVGVAQTGTGKTAAFGLPLLGRVQTAVQQPQALVLAPTRELALQTTTALQELAGPDSKMRMTTVYGGAPYGEQIRALRQGAQIVVGTPGRIIDLLERGVLDLSAVTTWVLDEADEMLQMGFAEDMELIAKALPPQRLTALFSATMPRQIEAVAAKHLTDPQRIQVASSATPAENTRQTYALVPEQLRLEALSRFLQLRQATAPEDSNATIVFVRTRRDAEDIATALVARGIRASGISSDIAQKERERLIGGLRRGGIDVLVATDVAARGLDVDRVGYVVNYEPPRDAEAYVHRIGRTGRAGRSGESLTLFTTRDRGRLRRFERVTRSRLEQVEVPTAGQLQELRGQAAIARALQPGEMIPHVYVTLLEQARKNGLRYRDLAVALLDQLAAPEGPQAVSAVAQERQDKAFAQAGQDRPKAERGRGKDYRRYRVEVGKRDGASPKTIVGAITGEGGVRGDALGKISIYPSFSLVEVQGGLSQDQLKQLEGTAVRGRKLSISVDRGGQRGARSGWAPKGGRGQKGPRGRGKRN